MFDSLRSYFERDRFVNAFRSSPHALDPYANIANELEGSKSETYEWGVLAFGVWNRGEKSIPVAIATIQMNGSVESQNVLAVLNGIGFPGKVRVIVLGAPQGLKVKGWSVLASRKDGGVLLEREAGSAPSSPPQSAAPSAPASPTVQRQVEKPIDSWCEKNAAVLRFISQCILFSDLAPSIVRAIPNSILPIESPKIEGLNLEIRERAVDGRMIIGVEVHVAEDTLQNVIKWLSENYKCNLLTVPVSSSMGYLHLRGSCDESNKSKLPDCSERRESFNNVTFEIKVNRNQNQYYFTIGYTFSLRAIVEIISWIEKRYSKESLYFIHGNFSNSPRSHSVYARHDRSVVLIKGISLKNDMQARLEGRLPSETLQWPNLDS